ncbi:MAG: Holliday junction resolvase RuvX [Clostridia bacterium]|nr:Holliday junction resolvase RuvX [Clostridia bacterium]
MNKRIVALDVGDRRIGIAVSDALGYTAQPVETYTRVGYGPDVRHIAAIAAQYETDRILCGLPLNMDGTHGFQAEKVREFAAKLEEAGLFVAYHDERMTTMLAESALMEANMRREDRKKKVDMVAAVMTLESYLDAQRLSSANEDEDEAEAEDDDSEDGLLEMIDEDGNAVRFLLSAKIVYRGEEYVLLTCAEDAGDIVKDESFIMRSSTDADGNPCYQSLDDQKLIAEVYEAYLKQSEQDE